MGLIFCQRKKSLTKRQIIDVRHGIMNNDLLLGALHSFIFIIIHIEMSHG